MTLLSQLTGRLELRSFCIAKRNLTLECPPTLEVICEVCSATPRKLYFTHIANLDEEQRPRNATILARTVTMAV